MNCLTWRPEGKQTAGGPHLSLHTHVCACIHAHSTWKEAGVLASVRQPGNDSDRNISEDPTPAVTTLETHSSKAFAVLFPVVALVVKVFTDILHLSQII